MKIRTDLGLEDLRKRLTVVAGKVNTQEKLEDLVVKEVLDVITSINRANDWKDRVLDYYDKLASNDKSPEVNGKYHDALTQSDQYSDLGIRAREVALTFLDSQERFMNSTQYRVIEDTLFSHQSEEVDA